jgi:hypothetical protein
VGAIVAQWTWTCRQDRDGQRSDEQRSNVSSNVQRPMQTGEGGGAFLGTEKVRRRRRSWRVGPGDE